MNAYARNTDPDTSHEAAASLDDLTARRRAVLHVLQRFGPSTDALLVATYETEIERGALLPRQSSSGIRTRRHELVDAGLVVDTGTRWRLSSGRNAIVWRAT